MMVDCIFPTSENKMTKIFPPYFGIFAYDGISRLIEFTQVLEMFEIDNHDGLLFYFLIAVESGKTCFQFKRLIFFHERQEIGQELGLELKKEKCSTGVVVGFFVIFPSGFGTAAAQWKT